MSRCKLYLNRHRTQDGCITLSVNENTDDIGYVEFSMKKNGFLRDCCIKFRAGEETSDGNFYYEDGVYKIVPPCFSG